MELSEDYQGFKSSVMKRKTKPYVMSNDLLAIELFDMFKTEYPTASIHFYGIWQYICFDDRARKTLLKQFKRQKEEQERALHATAELIDEIKTNMAHKGK